MPAQYALALFQCSRRPIHQALPRHCWPIKTINLAAIWTIISIAGCVVLSGVTAFAQQGAVRMLYTVPNTTFIEQPAGESVVTINDTSGSISTLQTAINNARSANPD